MKNKKDKFKKVKIKWEGKPISLGMVKNTRYYDHETGEYKDYYKGKIDLS